MDGERISGDELQFHQRLIGKVNHDLEVARAPLLLWNQHLVEKYHLGPLDTVDEAGVIVRTLPPTPQPANGAVAQEA